MEKKRINPNQDAKDLSMCKWIWTYNRGYVIFVFIIAITFTIGAILTEPDTTILISCLMIGWTLLNAANWIHTYKKNLREYHRWERLYGEKEVQE